MAVLTRWKLAPRFSESLFRFETPEGVERVDAAALIPHRSEGAQ
jgi:hypothetical protein